MCHRPKKHFREGLSFAIRDGDEVAGTGLAADLMVSQILKAWQDSGLSGVDNGGKNRVSLGVTENRQALSSRPR